MQQSINIQKIEIHALADQLDELSFLAEEHAEMISYYKLRRRKVYSPGNKRVIQGNERAGAAVVRIDAYLTGRCEPLLHKLSRHPAVLDVNNSLCRLGYLKLVTVDEPQEKLSEVKARPLEDSKGEKRENAPMWKVVGPQAGMIRVTVGAKKGADFLCKIFGMLAEHEIMAVNGSKYRQSDMDYCTVTFQEIGKELLERLKEELTNDLADTAVDEQRYGQITQGFQAENLEVTADLKTSLPAIRIRARGGDPLLRLMIQEVFYARGVDIVLGRMTKVGDDINDTYYVTSLSNEPIDINLISRIKIILSGVQRC